jgi:hypothetical protein
MSQNTMFEVIHHFSQLSSCVGTNSCGVGAPVQFGATTIDSTNVNENYLSDSNSTTSYAMTGSNQGMFNDYASINAFWSEFALRVQKLGFEFRSLWLVLTVNAINTLFYNVIQFCMYMSLDIVCVTNALLTR